MQHNIIVTRVYYANKKVNQLFKKPAFGAQEKKRKTWWKFDFRDSIKIALRLVRNFNINLFCVLCLLEKSSQREIIDTRAGSCIVLSKRLMELKVFIQCGMCLVPICLVAVVNST